MAGSASTMAKPMSVKEISQKAQDFNFNPFIAMKYWMRTADTLLREAQIYENEQNDQQAYLLLMRWASLVMDSLPLHPSAKEPENREGLRAIQKHLPMVLDELECLKPRINARYKAWERALDRSRQASLAVQHERLSSVFRPDFASSDPAVAGNTTTLGAAENSQLAVKLAHQEIRRRDAARRSTRQAGVSEQEEQKRRVAGLWDDWEDALSKDKGAHRQEEDELRRDMEATRRRVDGSHDIVPDNVGQKRISRSSGTGASTPPKSSSNQYRYPSITGPQPFQTNNPHVGSQSTSLGGDYLPPKPPKERYESPSHDVEPPALPAKPTTVPSEGSKSIPSANFTFRPSAYLESGEPLRTVFLPPTLRKEFLRYAEANTSRNIETCGMLCGTLISNALFVQRLVIPDQTGSSDMCETINESAFFDYCESEDLLQLGWIHTHPTQTCFMSSRDCHTHCGYQMMMAESIAIVCAPRQTPSWGVFRLTDPPGKQAIAQCRHEGIFHPHEETNIYTDALRPGHVFEAEGLEFSVVDLRP